MECTRIDREHCFYNTTQFKKSVVDTMKLGDDNPRRIPGALLAIKWAGPPDKGVSFLAHRVNLLGAKPPDNFFRISLPGKVILFNKCMLDCDLSMDTM